MKIAIIGAGSVGSALGDNWARKGHEILFGVRDPADNKHAALATRERIEVTTVTAAAGEGEVVILATPWPAVEQVLTELGDLEGKVLIDCTNPLGMTDAGLALTTGFTTSGGELVAQWAQNARVVKSFNQVGAEIMKDPGGFAHPPVMFVAGDDEAAKAVATNLLTDLGFEPFDAGALHQARLLEPFAMVWINQSLLRGKGRDWAFAALPREG